MLGVLNFYAAIKSATSTTQLLILHRWLVFEMAKRELKEQFAGQILGSIWTIIHPLLLIGVYVFVFGFVFRVKIGGSYKLPFDYTTYILAGMIPWLTLQTNLTKVCSVITANSNLVKQVVFPLEVLPVKTVLVSLISQCVSVLIVIGHVVFSYGYLPWTYSLLPVLIVMQLVLSIGVGFVLSALCVFIRDIREFVTVFSFVGMFVLPISYLPQWVPKLFKPFLYINPFSYLIWCYQDVLYYGRFEHPYAWIFLITFTIVSYSLGSYIFRNVKQLFGDVL